MVQSEEMLGQKHFMECLALCVQSEGESNDQENGVFRIHGLIRNWQCKQPVERYIFLSMRYEDPRPFELVLSIAGPNIRSRNSEFGIRFRKHFGCQPWMQAEICNYKISIYRSSSWFRDCEFHSGPERENPGKCFCLQRARLT